MTAHPPLRFGIGWKRYEGVSLRRGAIIERPVPKVVEISEKLDDWQRKVEGLIVRLTDGVPDDVGDRTVEEQARWLLAFMLDWHGREKKAVWWEYFRLRDLSAEDLASRTRRPRRTNHSLSRLAAPPRRPCIATNSSCRIPTSEPKTISGASEELSFGTCRRHFPRRSDDRYQEARRHGRFPCGGGLRA